MWKLYKRRNGIPWTLVCLYTYIHIHACINGLCIQELLGKCLRTSNWIGFLSVNHVKNMLCVQDYHKMVFKLFQASKTSRDPNCRTLLAPEEDLCHCSFAEQVHSILLATV